jgi:hypothetical protein
MVLNKINLEGDKPVIVVAKTSFYHKKGQTQGAVGAVIGLIIGIGVAVLVLVFIGVLSGQAYNITEDKLDEIGNNIVTAENVGFLTNTSGVQNSLSFNHYNVQEGTLKIYNTSAPNTEWGLTNFSISYADKGSISFFPAWDNDSAGLVNNTEISANYTWGNDQIRTSIDNAIISGFSALEDTGSYLPLIVLGIVIFLVLSLVLGISALAQGGGGFQGSAL